MVNINHEVKWKRAIKKGGNILICKVTQKVTKSSPIIITVAIVPYVSKQSW